MAGRRCAWYVSAVVLFMGGVSLLFYRHSTITPVIAVSQADDIQFTTGDGLARPQGGSKLFAPDAIGNTDTWFRLQLAKTKSFNICYENKILDPNRHKCEYTDDPARIEESDAVLLRGVHLRKTRLPEYRAQHQKWVFVEVEPPYKVGRWENLSTYNGLFNLTATYSLDSSIPKPWYWKMCIKDQAKWESLKDVDYWGKKTREVPVAWFVSTCKSQSLREAYVKELQRYIDVDIYGKCGPLECGSKYTWLKDNCDRQLLHEQGSYKFYLAFENSLCEDYISEKLWKLLQLDVIPVVMGAVDYSNMLPKDSFIDARDFASPKELAEHLKRVAEDQDLYNQYIRNKNSLQCTTPHVEIPWGCRLCRTLHELRGKTQVIYQLDTFWGMGRCMSPTMFWSDIKAHADTRL